MVGGGSHDVHRGSVRPAERPGWCGRPHGRLPLRGGAARDPEPRARGLGRRGAHLRRRARDRCRVVRDAHSLLGGMGLGTLARATARGRGRLGDRGLDSGHSRIASRLLPRVVGALGLRRSRRARPRHRQGAPPPTAGRRAGARDLDDPDLDHRRQRCEPRAPPSPSGSALSAGASGSRSATGSGTTRSFSSTASRDAPCRCQTPAPCQRGTFATSPFRTGSLSRTRHAACVRATSRPVRHLHEVGTVSP